MSYSYTIQVSEGVEVVARSGDSVCTQLASLAVLPESEMSQWLGKVLVEGGYLPVEGHPSRYTREVSGARLEIDASTRQVTASVLRERSANTGRITINVTDRKSDAAVESQATQAIARSASELTTIVEKELAKEASEELAQVLPAIRGEIDAVNHRWLSAAIKDKASRLGQVQRIDENESARSLTISIKV